MIGYNDAIDDWKWLMIDSIEFQLSVIRGRDRVKFVNTIDCINENDFHKHTTGFP